MVQAWLAADPDPDDRRELARLRAEVGTDPTALDRLRECFRTPLRFGTAGLRGPLRPGPAGMNTAVVRRATAGLARWLLPLPVGPPSPTPLVVIGYDARHRSEAFALDAARVAAGAGLRVLVLPEALPTPVLAFAVRRLRAHAGIMITASHNPAGDNGYKVFLGGSRTVDDPGWGAQLVAPVDQEIERHIAGTGPAATLRLRDHWQRLDQGIVTQYVRAAASTVLTLTAHTPVARTPTAQARATTGPADPAGSRATGIGVGVGVGVCDGGRPVVVHTPLHGVGGRVLAEVFMAAGLAAPIVVDEQAEPDPDFPTVRWPNPEEPGALDLALALADRVDADLVIATDPDADRCAVAVDGRLLTGDEIGLLLADLVLAHRPGPVATTVVSSRGLRALADERGVPHRETLTGFKWIMRADPRLVFGYEEALGYAVAPELVRDKDGITAALALALLATTAKRRGRTLSDLLDDLAARLGVHVTAQRSVRLADPNRIAAVMRRLRATPPSSLAGLPVTTHRDLLRTEPAPGAGPGLGPAAGIRTGLPPADVLVLHLGPDRVIFRPSGTEPKLKAYLEVVEPVPGAAPAAVGPARTRARTRLTALAAAVDALLTDLDDAH
ncbi:phospho-sugar mutase [Frankia sp. Ag45/Mut15]|uniref:Phospho-sugar mutase n=1 Tax=Frankia umida TaxID=573489 RepID=A0ABT0K2L2_9ACTN|nr:phospho-sugar mutase [Frankia umida]MCK9877956.1 phospho-sugar mutase [Frankia umida]